MLRLFAPKRLPAPELEMRGPMSEEYVRELQKRLAEKRAAAIAQLGDRWLLHPSRRIR